MEEMLRVEALFNKCGMYDFYEKNRIRILTDSSFYSFILKHEELVEKVLKTHFNVATNPSFEDVKKELVMQVSWRILGESLIEATKEVNECEKPRIFSFQKTKKGTRVKKNP